MKLKKVLALTLTLALSVSMMAGCAPKPAGDTTSPSPSTSPAPVDTTSPAPEAMTIQVAALESAYGAQVWKDIGAAFTAQSGINVEFIIEKNLEDVIGPSMQGGDYPDVIHLATGREKGLTDQFIKDNNLVDLTDVLTMTVPGETVKVGEKIANGFTDTSLTNPYNDGKTYLMPMFYGPCGLFYDANLLATKGWEVPTTWDEMWALGDMAKAEGIYLFTYPTTGYFDAFLYSLMYAVGGPVFFDQATHYAEGIWDTAEGQQVFDIIAKLASYTNPVTPAQANDNDFKQNQQLILDNKAVFMPNGNWIVGEMADSPRVDGFEWAVTGIPAVKAGGDRYSFTWFEQIWMPNDPDRDTARVDAAKQFLAFLYSDTACKIFIDNKNSEGKPAPVVQPVLGIVDMLPDDMKVYYTIYDTGIKPAMGGFAAYNSVAGLGDTRSVFLDPVNKLVEGTITKEQWISDVKAASDQMRANLK